MKVNSINKFNQEHFKKYAHPQAIIVDATCGNGNDTLYLAQNCPHKELHALDIQEQALVNSRKKCYNYPEINYHLVNHSDEDVKKLFKEVDLVVYNLGYLPHANSKITTQGASTSKSIALFLDLLTPRGGIVITIYTGHDNGREEKIILEYIASLRPQDYVVACYKLLNLDAAPYTIVIEKK